MSASTRAIRCLVPAEELLLDKMFFRVALLSLFPTSVMAANGPSPAVTPPAELWSELHPLDQDQIAPDRDQSGYNEYMTPPWATRLFMDITGHDGEIWTADHWGLSIWHADPGELPTAAGSIDYFDFPFVEVGEPAKRPIQYIAVAPPPYSIAALGGAKNNMPLTLVDVAAAPFVRYQDGGVGNTKLGRGVAVALTETRAFTLLAAPPGLHAYDMVAAKAAVGYVELAPEVNSEYPEVYRGLIFDDFVVAQLASDRDLVVVADLTGATALLQISDDGEASTLGEHSLPAAAMAIDLWQHRDHTYAAALIDGSRLLLYRLDALIAGDILDFGAPLVDLKLPIGVSVDARLVASTSDGIPALYVTNTGEPAHNEHATTKVRDLLFDLRDPSSPRLVDPLDLETGHYLSHALQFGWVRPMSVHFVGRTLHRAAGGVYDIHEWTPPDEAPLLLETPPDVCVPGEEYQWAIEAVDPEGAELDYTLVAGPSGIVLSAAGEIAWECSEEDSGENPVSVIIFDGTRETLVDWTISVAHVDSGTGEPMSTTGSTATTTSPAEMTESAGTDTGTSTDAATSGLPSPPSASGGTVHEDDANGCTCRTSAARSRTWLLLPWLLVMASRRRRTPSR